MGPAFGVALDLDEFRLIRMLGQGGMGAVYLGYDTVLEREVAIKVLRERTNDEAARQRFLIEARAIARLDHPNVIAIYRAATTRDGHPYLVEELVRGTSLDRAELPLSPERIAPLALGISRGLAAAHRRGILHRDIKPANVMIDEAGAPKLLDFGVAKLVGAEQVPAAPAGPTARARPNNGVAETLDPVRDGMPSAIGATVRDTAPSFGSHETAEGVVGTPRYMAPEIWRGEPATARSDLYSLGVLLYEISTGAPPFPQIDPSALESEVTEGARPVPIEDLAPSIPAELAALITACMARDPAQRPESSDEVVHRIERLLVGAPAIPDGNPYPGLAPFSPEQRAVFYGRGSDVSAVVDRLRSDPLVIVAGDSGIGKSSLCRAGVLPAITAGALGDARTWRTRTVSLGRHAEGALREVLGRADVRDLSPTEISRGLEVTPTTGTVLFFDQFEELVTLNDAAEADAAAQVIVAMARGIPGIRILVAVRGDFLTRVAALPALAPVVARSLHLLRVLSLADAREAVVWPARAKGVKFESEAMVEALASSVIDAPGALPLLSFALAELWQRRDVDGARIPAAALDEIGGVAGALARHADAVIGALSPVERAAARRISLLLVTRDGTRADRLRAELCPEDDPGAAPALEAMIRGRLVVARNTPTGDPTYELAHDSLIAAWSTLRGWRENVAGQHQLRTRLAEAAAEWRRLGRPSDSLWRRAQLGEVEALDELSEGDRAFLEASRRSARRRRLLLVGFVTSLPLVIFGTWLFVQHRASVARAGEVSRHVEIARERLREAELARDAATQVRTEAFQQFDLGGDTASAAAEAKWLQVAEPAERAHTNYAAALSELEVALSIDPARHDVRAQLAQVLLDRALLAEAERDLSTAEVVAARIPLFDDTGELTARWRRPGQLVVEAPTATRIELRRYDARDRRLVVGEPIASVTSTRLVRDLDAGSYVIEASGADGFVVRYPVIVGRGQRRSIALAIPKASAIPDGMIYVPAGPFLAGAATGDEMFRAFLKAVPLHEVTTPAYLIGRTEVTFAEWMAFLRSLPPAEREKRRPRVSGASGASTVLAGGNRPGDPFVITFQATTTAQSAREGQPLIFVERDRRREVHWERTPVIGISYSDAQAYTAWLASRGLGGARICTEREWERAARGADGRLWAHGDWIDATATDDANLDATYGRNTLAFGPDEVGEHPLSTSPFGLVDTIGNAWEWTTSIDNAPVMRGGSWYQGRSTAMTANRDPNDASARQWQLGLRVCANAP